MQTLPQLQVKVHKSTGRKECENNSSGLQDRSFPVPRDIFIPIRHLTTDFGCPGLKTLALMRKNKGAFVPMISSCTSFLVLQKHGSQKKCPWHPHEPQLRIHKRKCGSETVSIKRVNRRSTFLIMGRGQSLSDIN